MESHQKKVWAVTGATGFIGRHLVRRLVDYGFEVRALSRSHTPGRDASDVFWIRSDLAIRKCALEPLLDGVDVLVHCAGEIKDERTMALTNVYGTQNLVSAARNRVRRWVHLSSCGVYGPLAIGVVTEQSPLRPVGAYERTRLAAEQTVIEGSSDGQYTYSVLRPANVFGNDMHNQSLRNLVRMIDRRMFFFIGKSGSITNYVHVDNVVDALIQCGSRENAAGAVYNLSQPCLLEDFADLVCRHLGRPKIRTRLPLSIAKLAAAPSLVFPGYPLTFGRLHALTSRAIYSSERIVRELGFRMRVKLDDAIGSFVRTLVEGRSFYAGSK